ncbi:4'-phosphopantetheinyl transferase family protein [Streptomyces sp. AK04-3B]|uniref:4'-phosphopantetheinyl transferase family protein n=1 Tax=Streptomyces sp. AK04-3B TaxID=3028650 RepID=UPI0029B0872B|nr:4'-phosphopantetheinyl transferase superfamily protein [Streptomyces sp. AK04-3B]MDX3802315.1 4'-phosphopantetheinyl transferase superfamily protein [Streptomyces sp. AK04-3B]
MISVQVAWARLGDAHAGLLTLLDPVERGRHDETVAPGDRARFLVGCALSRLLLGELLDLPPADVPLRRVCPRCGGPHGKVRLDMPDAPAPYDFSVTHSGALVGVAVSSDGIVGLDVEDGEVPLDVDGAARTALSGTEFAALHALPPAERRLAFLRVWTRKEAVLKALGVGLRMPLRALEVSPPTAPPAVLAWPPPPAAPADPHPSGLHLSGPHPPDLQLSGLHPSGLRMADLRMADLLVDGVHPATVAMVVTAVTRVKAATGPGARDAVNGLGEVRVVPRDGSAVLAAHRR